MIGRNVSVVIPAYNCESTIGRTIESVSCIEGAEIIVVDDGSTDGSASVAEARDAIVIRQPNGGAHAARRAGIRRSERPLTILLDADDCVLPGMQESIRIIEAEPAYVAVGGAFVIDGSRQRQGPTPYPIVSTSSLLEKGYSPWPPSACVWRREALVRSWNLPIAEMKPPFAEDYELLVRVSTLGSVGCCSAATCIYQQSGGKSAKSALLAIETAERVRRYYGEALSVPVRLKSDVEMRRLAAIRSAKSIRGSSGMTGLAEWLVANPVSAGHLSAQTLNFLFARDGRGRRTPMTVYNRARLMRGDSA